MSAQSRTSSLDSAAARIAALAIALCALALMVWIGRNDMPVIRGLMVTVSGTGPVEESTGNPELDACLKDRSGAVDKMRKEGIINAAQYNEFHQRAVDYCEAQFPRN
ncbi:hypothetical protein [Roseibium aggregatum]|uniref:Uncharacterized protein n=1 Tax=Roseibium aggregatum TaxID=187304 RepID=A0A926NWP1_9HYPH|nr:hypothetical protein [Roseibium aggregatum]MBD1546689.1 hypothetical protein [Roseibium aggregatum]